MADLRVSIGADNSELNRSLHEAEARISAFVKKVSDIGDLGDKMSDLGTKLSAGLTLPIVGLGAAAIKSYGDIQALQKGLEAVMGSANAANAEFNRLKEVAKLPGLGMQEAVKGSINLQSIGMSAEKSRNILQQFGNAVATVGKGREEFERAVYGVQQLANTDFPLGEDLNIIKDALPQVSSLLKEAFGTSRSDELAKMGVSSQQVLDVITKGLEKLPRVSGGVKGAFENLSDSLKTSLGRIGAVIDKNLDISAIVEKISSGLETVVSWFENLNPVVQNSILVVAGLAAAAGPLLVAFGGFMAMLPTLTAGVGALSAAFTFLTGPIGLVTAGIIGIVTAVVANWGKIKPYLERTANNFIQLYNESQTFRGGILSIGFAFESLWAVVKSFTLSAYNAIKAFGKGVLNTFEGISLMIRGAFNRDLNMMSAGWAKANEKVSISYDNLGVRMDNVEKKYNALLANKRPLGKVSLGGIDINQEETATETAGGIVESVKKAAQKAKEKIKAENWQAIIPIKVSTPSFSIIENDPMGGLFTEEQINALTERMRNADSVIQSTMTDMQLKMAYAVADFNAAASQLLNEGITNGIADAAMAMGEALASGGNAVSAIGMSLLSSLGDILIQLGKMAISTAIGIIGIQTALKSLNPYVALAAGAALIALGAAVKGSMKGLGSSMGKGGGSYSSSGGGGSYSGSSSYYSASSSAGGGEVVFRISGNDLVGVLSRQQEKNSRLKTN